MSHETIHDLTDDERWHRVMHRDAGADGRFVMAVKTTGIYCRPSCPSRHPKRENVEFFDIPEAERAATDAGLALLVVERVSLLAIEK